MFTHLARLLTWGIAGCSFFTLFAWVTTLHPALQTFGDLIRVLFVVGIGAALLLDDAVLSAIGKAENGMVKLQYYAAVAAVFILFLTGWILMKVAYGGASG